MPENIPIVLPGSWRVCVNTPHYGDGEPLPERYNDVGEVHRALAAARKAEPKKWFYIRYVPDEYDTLDLFATEKEVSNA